MTGDDHGDGAGAARRADAEAEAAHGDAAPGVPTAKAGAAPPTRPPGAGRRAAVSILPWFLGGLAAGIASLLVFGDPRGTPPPGPIPLARVTDAREALNRGRARAHALEDEPRGARRAALVEEAVAAYDHALALPADAATHEDALRDSAGLLSREGRHDEAIARIERLLDHKPPPADAAHLRQRIREWRAAAEAADGAG